MSPRSDNTERSDAVGKKTKVRTTIEPGRVIEVDDSELLDLDRQGVIYSSEAGDGKHAWKPEETEAANDEAPADSKPNKKGA